MHVIWVVYKCLLHVYLEISTQVVVVVSQHGQELVLCCLNCKHFLCKQTNTDLCCAVVRCVHSYYSMRIYLHKMQAKGINIYMYDGRGDTQDRYMQC